MALAKIPIQGVKSAPVFPEDNAVMRLSEVLKTVDSGAEKQLNS